MAAKKMTKKQYDEKCVRGEFVFPAKFLSSVAERIQWRDKITRASMNAPILRHTVLTGAGVAVFVSERVDEKTFDETKYVQADFQQNDPVYVTFRTATMDKGALTVAGAEMFGAVV